MIQYKITKESNERYTPRYAVLPIIKYLPSGVVVWCPFDTDNSEFVLALKEHGFKVVHSHIMTGQDFFKYELSKIEDVQEVETYIVYRSKNLLVPYII